MVNQVKKDYYRQAFEAISGTLSDRRWRQIRNELERSGVTINLKSVQSYAQLKASYPRTVLTKQSLTAYENFLNKYSSYQEFTGEMILSILRQIKPNVTNRMLINAWYKAGLQFGKHSVYSYSQACRIVFFTAITRNK
ncbi:MAG: hypothetical protein EA343_08180 [Nodularia sp. (in: Bacteria)]|nr:MAG: hypothetical protein EA343_08180 [Nodularia sp. (in: cyanobacteria)]